MDCFGPQALLTAFPIPSVLRESSYQDALVRFGMIFAVVGLAAAQGLRRPDRAWVRGVTARASARVTPPIDVPPHVMVGTPVFWLMFAMMTMMSTTGLMVTPQMGCGG